MTTPPGYTLTSTTAERLDDFLSVAQWAFMFNLREIDREAFRAATPLDRARSAQIADPAHGTVGSVVGTYSSVTHGMRVPGGAVVKTSGLTLVGVHPGHRRRGLLTAMIADHFRASLAAGEPISTLYAMEEAIYGRFGYGSAAPRYRVSAGELIDMPGSDKLAVTFARTDHASQRDFIRAVCARVARPGTMAEPGESMYLELLQEWPSDLESSEHAILAMVEDEQGPAAYAVFRRKMGDNPSADPEATLTVAMHASATPLAAHRLFSTLLDMDIVNEVKLHAVPGDHEVIMLAKNRRELKPQLTDGLWLRILDLPAALTARSYAADCDVVIDVTDQQVPDNAGRWRFTITDGTASVARTSDAAGVALSIQDLSAAYLGTEEIRRKAVTGQIAETTPGAALALNAAFRSTQEPYANFWF